MSTRTTLPPEPFKWDEQTELLKQAAEEGSVEFLEECVSHNAPNQYYLSQFEDGNYVSNFLHIAVLGDRTCFVRKVMELLNPQLIHQLMLQQNKPFDNNPLHCAAFRGNVEVVKLFLEYCSSKPSLKPWLQGNSYGQTPCKLAIEQRKKECALEILKMDIELLSQLVDKDGVGLLHGAVDRGQWEVALKILESSPSFTCSGLNSLSPLHILPRDSDRQDVCRLLLQKAPHLVEYTDNRGVNILHIWAGYGKVWPFEYIIQNCNDIIPDIRRRVVNLMPKTTTESFGEEFLELLVDGNPKLLEGIAKSGRTILHIWAEIGYVWPFKYILQEYGINHPEWNSKLLPLLRKQDESGNTVFHCVVRNKKGKANDILQLLVNAFKELYSSWKTLHTSLLPWFVPNNMGNGALHEAMMNHRQELALNILSLVDDDYYLQLLDYFKPQCKILFLAMEYNCYQVAKKIVANLRKQDRTPYLKNFSNGKNILHLAPSCTDEEFGKWLVAQAPEFVLERDNIAGKTPLDEASGAGVDWIIRAMLQTNPTSIFNIAPLTWIRACQNGHISAVRAFIDCCPGRFKNHCVKHKDSPLHHIKLPNLTSYEDFLTIPHMKNLVNCQDSNERTPLHKAIQDRNIHLAEVLLNVEDVLLDIKDKDKQTVRYLLGEICKKEEDWKNMCHDNGFDLSMRLTYLQRKTNSIDTRNTLSVVAALLATITFTAGFTLPGGFNQDTGEAILAKKAAFLVFLISDTIALCTSMLVLTCLIWSMVYDPDKSMLLIDRSMKLLMLSLYSTMIAFMCGVFIVISQKSMWAAILVIVICSLLGLSAKRSLLYYIVNKLFPSPNSECKDRFHLLESGKALCCRGGSSCLKCN